MFKKTEKMNRTALNGYFRLSLLSLSIAAAAPMSFAEDAGGKTTISSSVFEKITVTSQKREQFLDDVSIAVTAFSEPQMDMLGVESSIDLIAFSPNVSRAGDLGGQRSIFNIPRLTFNF